MLKYVGAAAALRAFSLSPQTRYLYRQLGNNLGQRNRTRQGLPPLYITLAQTILDCGARHDALHDGDKVLEIGTGWVHWGATVLRLFYDIEVTLADVWDNRHFQSYQHYMNMFADVIDDKFTADPSRLARARGALTMIRQSSSFEEVYSHLGFRYEVNPAGDLRHLPDDYFDSLFSINVMEHIHRDVLPRFLVDTCRVLEPGGHSIHIIDLGDHLSYYDRSVSTKNYLRYSDRMWRRLFENEVQYFNRVQRPEWLDLFTRSGLTLIEEEPRFTDLHSMIAAKEYSKFDRKDLECTHMTVVHQKACTASPGGTPCK